MNRQYEYISNTPERDKIPPWYIFLVAILTVLAIILQWVQYLFFPQLILLPRLKSIFMSTQLKRVHPELVYF
jgi:hypothetical protein